MKCDYECEAIRDFFYSCIEVEYMVLLRNNFTAVNIAFINNCSRLWWKIEFIVDGHKGSSRW